MPHLFLNRVNTQYKSWKNIIKVQNEPYKGFRIFERIRFIDVDSVPFHFFAIIANKDVIMKDYESRNYFLKDNIDYVDVYVYKYNKDKPLIIGVNNAGDYTYYKWIDLVPNNRTGIHNLTNSFVPEFKLSTYLIDANDEINRKITFRIDKTEDYNNIHLEKEVTASNFVIYTHEPKDAKFKENESCILINNVFFNPKSTNKIEQQKYYNSENRKIKKMRVYSRSTQWYPLLVKLVESETQYYYFYRRNKNTWIHIEFKDESKELYEKLDEIEFRTHYSMNVFLDQQRSYSNDLFNNDIGSRTTVPKIDVSPVKYGPILGKYEFFVHDLKKYSEFVHQPETFLGKFLVLRFLIFNNEIEISGKEDHIVFKDPNLYVYFYKGDNVPLLFRYEGKYYRPKSRELYFDTWVEVQGLSETPVNDDRLKKELDTINKMLNEVNIDKTSDYGPDYNVELNDYDDEPDCFTKECQIQCKKNKKLGHNSSDYTRIKVKREKYGHFTRFTHTTKNNFNIGSITYKSKKLLDDSSIDYTSVVSVTVYYFDFNSETNKGYPLLLKCETTNSLNYYHISDNRKIDGKDETPKFKKINVIFETYDFLEFAKTPRDVDFYNKLSNILELTKTLGDVDDFDNEPYDFLKPTSTLGGVYGFSYGLHSFLEHKNYFLNNVICFSIDKTSEYKCCKGNNPYCQKILVEVTPVEIGENEALKNAKYKTYGHRAVNNKDQILKLRILYGKEKTNASKPRLEIKAKNLKISSNIIRLTHSTDPKKDPLFDQQDVYVHFYGDDPRPLLVYSDNSAFAPDSIGKYNHKWSLVQDIDYSKRGDGNHELYSVLYKLHQISYKLNPVDIYLSANYPIDKYFGKEIYVNVSSDKLDAYKFYKHTPSEGHRLGVLKYRDITVDPGYSYFSNDIKEVFVYYYHFDESNSYPLLIKLVFNNVPYNMYYLLSSLDPLQWSLPYRNKLEHHSSEKYTEPTSKILELLSRPDFNLVTKDIFSEFGITDYEPNTLNRSDRSSSSRRRGRTQRQPGEDESELNCQFPGPRGDDYRQCRPRNLLDNEFLSTVLDTLEQGQSAYPPTINGSESSDSSTGRAKRSDIQTGEDKTKQNCQTVRGDTVACDQTPKNKTDKTHLLPALKTIIPGDSPGSSTTEESDLGNNNFGDFVPVIPPNVNDVKDPDPTTDNNEYDSNLLLYIILGSLGALLAIGVCILLLYLFFKIYLKDMRPSL